MKEHLDIIYKELEQVDWEITHKSTKTLETLIAWRKRLIATKDAIILKIMEIYEE